jgi:hypothetical protein
VGQAHLEAGSPLAAVPGADAAAVGLDDLAGHVQAQAQAAVVAHRRGALEAAEDAVEVLLGDAGAAIGHGQHRFLAFAVHPDPDRATGAVLDGVREQVGQHLLHAQPIPGAFQLGGLRHLQRAALLDRGVAHPVHHVAGSVAQVEALGAQLEAAGGDAGDVEERLDQVGQPLAAPHGA